MPNNNLSILRKFVMEYGSILGLCWVAVFSFYVIGFRTQNGIFMLLGMCGIFGLLALEIFYAIRIKKRTVQLDLKLSALLTYLNSLSMFMYACLLCGCLEYIYFAYIDKGMLFTSIQSMIDAADIQSVYKQMGMSDYYKQVTTTISQLQSLSALEKTMVLFNQNFFFSLILAIPVAIVSYFYKPAILK